jgi:hypothetical protein
MEQLAKRSSGASRTRFEVLVNRLAEQRGFVCSPGGTFEVDAQRQRRVTRQIARPFDNEFLRTGIHVALTEWGRIDGVEELA